MSDFLFAGLGNPGFRYVNTRHNAGFMFLDFMSSFFNFSAFKYETKFNADITKSVVAGHKVYLLKPDTYMNLSGKSVAPFVNYYDIPKENIFIVHDEMDFDFGVFKIKKGGGAAGHNGIKSIQEMLGYNDFYRIRLGIGKPEGFIEGADWVLGKFHDKELACMDKDLSLKWKELFITIIEKGIVPAMNSFNKK